MFKFPLDFDSYLSTINTVIDTIYRTIIPHRTYNQSDDGTAFHKLSLECLGMKKPKFLKTTFTTYSVICGIGQGGNGYFCEAKDNDNVRFKIPMQSVH